MAAANAIASLADSGRNGSSSSLSSAGMSRSDRDGGGGIRAGAAAADWGGVAGRGPPVAPQCDYVVDKVLGRKVFLVPVRVGMCVCIVYFVFLGFR